MELARATPPIRCAIYTRKSTEEGLDQEVNSLQAQRDTCSAYVRSQRHKGWTELAQHYDDGGWSGGNLTRPALQRLLSDIEDGRIDVVVLYKIDRLSRSLADFFRLIDIFERFGVSFVSITQAFDTSESMGRLVLNVLLTFAQFERELLSDRLKDKFAALRRRGKWIGGRAPFGYDRSDKRLVVNPAEAEIIRDIYRRYPEASSGNQLLNALRSEGVRNKIQVTRFGEPVGGHLINAGLLHKVLTNPLYLGIVAYRGEWFPGEHAAIVTREAWDRVQAKRALRHDSQIPRHSTNSMLQGILHDANGRRMHPDVLVRNGRRFAYYATELTNEGRRRKLKVIRVTASEIETVAVTALRALLLDRPALTNALSSLGNLEAASERLHKAAPRMARKLAGADRAAAHSVIRVIVRRAEIDRERLRLFLSCVELARLLTWDGIGLFKAGADAPARRASLVHVLDAPCAIVREARAMILPIAPAAPFGVPDPGLIRLLQEARGAQEAIYASRHETIAQIATRFGRGASLFSRLVRLNYLAPDIVTAIIDGHQPADLNRTKLLATALPFDWGQQRLLLGFPSWPQDGLSQSLTARNHAPRSGGGAAI